MTEIKFTYFDFKAVGEPIRLLMKYGGIDFVDNRIKYEDWPKIKSTMPYGQVPILEMDGKVVHQSTAIARYFAKRVKLVGDNVWEEMEIDAVVDTINDFRSKIQACFYEKDAAVKETRKVPLFQETIPFYIGKFEELAKNNNGHLAVGKLTWADFCFVGILDFLNKVTETNLIGGCPNLEKLVQNVTSIPTIKAWIDVRPKTDI
ncbi:glutathione s-transferase [Holotrichia oblita]|uniref:Glutathione s-transferase n=1 Tax=Holotrichia oblita TaxID=644536 RepID=A0ACB9TXH4_HOLOL|nr:glutathione s-transferase [Holotrichia oblita]